MVREGIDYRDLWDTLYFPATSNDWGNQYGNVLERRRLGNCSLFNYHSEAGAFGRALSIIVWRCRCFGRADIGIAEGRQGRLCQTKWNFACDKLTSDGYSESQCSVQMVQTRSGTGQRVLDCDLITASLSNSNFFVPSVSFPFSFEFGSMFSRELKWSCQLCHRENLSTVFPLAGSIMRSWRISHVYS
jgi:hypothetical protein